MKKFAIVLALGALVSTTSAFAHAGISAFSCKTDNALKDGKRYTIKFKIKNLGTRSADGVWEGRDSEERVVTVTPKNPEIETLNENFSLNVSPKFIELQGDGDGFELLYLRLYADRDYTKGYFRIDDTGNNTEYGDQYVTVTCRIKQTP